MKKNLLTLMFVIAFICVGVSVASAKSSSSLGNSVAGSKKVLVANTKAKSLKVKCMPEAACADELAVLLAVNAVYEYNCAPNYVVGCSSTLENMLIGAGMNYENCLLNSINSKNTDRTINRNKTVKSRDVTSGE